MPLGAGIFLAPATRTLHRKTMTVDLPLAISAKAICKAYGPTVALDNASVEVRAGTVHALLGENGAGKSTFVKVLSGLVRPDQGALNINGKPVTFHNPRDAHRAGVQTAFQEMTQIPDLTVTENLLLLNEPVGLLGRIRRRDAEEEATAHLASLGLSGIDPRAELRELDLVLRQKLEIARALYRKPRLLLLDEPTSTLTGPDIAWLGDIVARAKADGIAVIFISHHLHEVREFCEYMTVLRNGRDVGAARVEDLSDDEVIKLIIGRSLAATFPAREDHPNQQPAPALEARGISTESGLKNVSFRLAKGEVLGVAGLQGMGQNELFLSCFGAMGLSEGQLLVEGQEVSFAGPEDAIASGIGFVPEDRKTEGLFLTMDGTRNATLPSLAANSHFGLIDLAAERTRVRAAFEVLQLNRRAVTDTASSFSGGNQQKMVIAKWLLTNSRTLLLFDPTRGVDVGTKHEIYVLIRNFARSGGAVLVFSSEIPELANLCDRVMVMYGGRAAGEIASDALSEEAIMHLALVGAPVITKVMVA